MATLKNSVSDRDHILGDLNARVVLVEYGDYQCPHCRIAHATVRQVKRHFGQRMSFVFRNFPLSQIHPFAQMAAESAEFAATHDKFWEMHDLLFKRQDDFGSESFVDMAGSLKLDAAELQKALDGHEFTDRVRSDFTGGIRSGVNGTPTFFIQGERHDGPGDAESLIAKMEAAIAN